VLSPFFPLNEKDIVHPQFFRTINGTFVLELLTKLLKIGKTDIAEQGFAGVDACSQDGKIPIVVSRFYTVPVYRKIFEEIFKDGFCVFGIALEEFFEERGVKVFVEDERGSDFLHICNFCIR
jgi:hypothetical protein